MFPYTFPLPQVWIPTTEPVTAAFSFQLSPAPADLCPPFSISKARHAITAMPGTPAGFPELNFSNRLPPSGFRLPHTSGSGCRTPRAGSLDLFRCPQFRAACPRIAIAFQFSCRHRLFGQHTEVALSGALAKCIFHDAIFQRMKADHHHASSWLQNPRRRFEQRLQIFQFAVYEDSKSLKSLSRGMNSTFGLIHWPGRG